MVISFVHTSYTSFIPSTISSMLTFSFITSVRAYNQPPSCMQLVASSATRALLHLHQAVSKPLRQHDASHATLNTLFQGCGSDWSLAEPSQVPQPTC